MRGLTKCAECGGSGRDRNPNAGTETCLACNGTGRADVPSKAADDALLGYGWSYRGAGRYEHADFPGHVITVQAVSGRPWAPVVWTHEEPDRVRPASTTGVAALEYHLMRIDRDRRG
jgi:hypothetical protein